MLYDTGTAREQTDGQLLERFANGQGEAAELAFAVLVERHGPMVLRVCRAVLDDHHDTQDAFQATFLVLVRRARGLRVRDSLGPWLHQVASRTARCARADASRRRWFERRASAVPRIHREETSDERERVIHEEIERLSERARAVVVLCDLGGQSQEQAARQLGWPLGTVKSRLFRARERLRERLRRRGFEPCALPVMSGPPLSLSAVDSVARLAARYVAARSVVPASVALLAQGVLSSMNMIYWLKFGAILTVLGAAAATAAGTMNQGDGKNAGGQPVAPNAAVQAPQAPNVVEVKLGPFRGGIIEHGTVEASRNPGVYSMIQGQTTIRSIVPEGTHVQKGQMVCELDSAILNGQLTNQVLTTKKADEAYQNAKLAREIAEIALTEYIDGIYKQEFETASREITLSKTAADKAKARLERTQIARKKLTNALAVGGGGRTAVEIMAELDIEDRIDASEQVLARATFSLKQAETKLYVLEKYTKDKTVKELKSEVEKARANELSKQATGFLEKSKEEKLTKQIANCKILAPAEGMVVYANDLSRTKGLRPQIEEGATIRERQKIFSIPDLSEFVVIAKVRESVIDRVKPGLEARVKVEGFGKEAMIGVILNVAPLHDPIMSEAPIAKFYTTRIKLRNAPAGLWLGMVADVEIIMDEVDDVISVPLTAVQQSTETSGLVAVKTPDGSFEWREVTIGLKNDKAAGIRNGLNPGDVVATDWHEVMFQKPTAKKPLPSPEK